MKVASRQTVTTLGALLAVVGIGAGVSFLYEHGGFSSFLSERDATTLVASPASRGGLADKVVITYQGADHVFLKSEAEDRGDFHSPAGFTQKNLCDVADSLPHMTVCFRPDANGGRDEVVFEYGTFKEVPVRLTGYTASFYSGETSLGMVTVSKPHTFYQRWRWIPDGYRPRYRSVNSLENAGLLLPFRKEYSSVANSAIDDPAPSRFRYAEPLDSGGVYMYFPATGERSEIGLVTNVQGLYLLSQSDAWWSAVLAQAEGGMSIPWSIRDEGGTPINWFRSGPGIANRLSLDAHYNNRKRSSYLPTDGNGWHVDDAHQPALFYLPWILTGDPYYLEGLQFQNSRNTLFSSYRKKKSNLARITASQYRGVAWNFRSLVQLQATTPASVPSWLLPRSYYVRQAQENIAELEERTVKSDDPLPKILNIADHHSSGPAFWQHDFLTAVLGWGVLMGNTEYKPLFEWAIKNPIARVNGTSGWPRRNPIVYYLTTRTVTSWEDAWNQYSETAGVTLPEEGVNAPNSAYTFYLRGTLALATHLNIEGADSYFRWLQEQMGARGTAKWAIAPKYALGGGGLPPLPDVVDQTPVLSDVPTTPVPDTDTSDMSSSSDGDSGSGGGSDSTQNETSDQNSSDTTTSQPDKSQDSDSSTNTQKSNTTDDTQNTSGSQDTRSGSGGGSSGGGGSTPKVTFSGEPSCSLRISPSFVRAQETAVLHWSVENAISIAVHAPDNTLIVASNKGGNTRVRVEQPGTYVAYVVGTEERAATCTASVLVEERATVAVQDRVDTNNTSNSGGGGESQASSEGESKSKSSVFTRRFTRGVEGNDVHTLQQLLSRDSSLYPEGLVTGYYGPLTETAVERFKARFGITERGLGAATLEKLNEVAEKDGLGGQTAPSSGGVPAVTLTTTASEGGESTGDGLVVLRVWGPGETSEEIQVIQSFLATDPTLYPEAIVTGYYGELTQRAIERFQNRFGIVSSGSPSTTGYGYFGPQTRSKFNEVYGDLEVPVVLPSTRETSSSIPPFSEAQSAPTPARISHTEPLFSSTLTVGSVGEDVELLQELLARDKSVYPEGYVSGFFTPLTELAVRRFQRKHGIISSGGPSTTGYGAVGPATQEKLQQLYFR